MTNESSHSRAHKDYLLIIMVFAMAIFGVIAVCVASFTTESDPDAPLLNQITGSSYTMRQCLFLLVGAFEVGILMAVPFALLRRFTNGLYIGMIILLAFVTITNRAQGVKAWLDVLWNFTIQPSEFAKLTMILVLAQELSRSETPMEGFSEVMRIFALIGIPGLIILLEGETGSFLVIAFLSFIMMFFSGVNWKFLLGLILAVALICLAIYGLAIATGSDDYRLARILAFLNPDMYSSSDAYQMKQSQMAIGSGGLLGNGWFRSGSIAQLNYVPADWTDFIYATIGETFGFVGCFAVLIMYFLILLRMMHLAWYTNDKFGKLIIYGVFGMLLFHVLENIAMTLGLAPITGIPLPFLSYGGSNMITNMGGVGLVLNVTKNRGVIVNNFNAPQTQTSPLVPRKLKRAFRQIPPKKDPS